MRDMETDPLWEDTLMGGAFWKEQDKKNWFYNELWEDTLMGAEFWREEDRNNPYDTTYHVQYSGMFFPGKFYMRVCINYSVFSAS